MYKDHVQTPNHPLLMNWAGLVLQVVEPTWRHPSWVQPLPKRARQVGPHKWPPPLSLHKTLVPRSHHDFKPRLIQPQPLDQVVQARQLPAAVPHRRRSSPPAPTRQHPHCPASPEAAAGGCQGCLAELFVVSLQPCQQGLQLPVDLGLQLGQLALGGAPPAELRQHLQVLLGGVALLPSTAAAAASRGTCRTCRRQAAVEAGWHTENEEQNLPTEPQRQWCQYLASGWLAGWLAHMYAAASHPGPQAHCTGWPAPPNHHHQTHIHGECFTHLSAARPR